MIELLIVMVIMAVFTTLIVPSMASAMRNRTISGCGKNIREMVEFARAAALSRHRPATLNIDPARRLCWVSMTDMSLPWIKTDEPPVTRILASVPVPEGTQCSVTPDLADSTYAAEPTESVTDSQWQTLTFNSDGTAEDVLIELTDINGEQYSFHVKGATGETYVEEIVL